MADVGKRLYALRTMRGLSQREVAKRAGVTNSTISLIEQNRVSPSVGSLKKVLDGFPVSLAEFFTMGVEENEASVIFRKEDQPDLGSGDIRYLLIGVGRSGRKMSILREIMAPGSDTGKDMLKHQGEEGGVVIRGELELTVGESVYRLGPGDGYYFESDQPHRFRNVGAKDLLLVSASTPPTF